MMMHTEVSPYITPKVTKNISIFVHKFDPK